MAVRHPPAPRPMSSPSQSKRYARENCIILLHRLYGQTDRPALPILGLAAEKVGNYPEL